MDAMEMIEMLESAWFFSSVFTTKTTGHSSAKIESKQERSSDSPEAIKPINISPQNQPKPSKSLKSPQEKRSVAVPVTEETASDVSRSPRRREEDERRRMRRWQRNHANTNREICRGLNLEGEIEFCRGRELKELKDLKAMKRQLKTWAMAVASSSVAQTRPITALCC